MLKKLRSILLSVVIALLVICITIIAAYNKDDIALFQVDQNAVVVSPDEGPTE